MNRVAARVALAATCFALAVAAPVAFAGKGDGSSKGGPKSGTSSSSLRVDQSGPYHFGQSVTVTTDVVAFSGNRGPWISMACRQDGAVVGTDTHAGFEGGAYYGSPFNLGPSDSWTGGAADCTFTVFHLSESGRFVTDATTSLHVEA